VCPEDESRSRLALARGFGKGVKRKSDGTDTHVVFGRLVLGEERNFDVVQEEVVRRL
jgi:hypothetical protein